MIEFIAGNSSFKHAVKSLFACQGSHPWNNHASDVAMIMIKYLNYVNLCEAVILFPEQLSVIYLSKTFVE